MRAVVAYATKHGSTREVAEAIGGALAAAGVDAEVRAAAEIKTLDGYDAVVVGGALYTGRWHRDARRFLARHRRALAVLPLAVFAMGPRTLDEADVAQSREQLEHALADVPELRPAAVAIFGGVVDPAALHFPFSKLPATDARDWDAIDAWARKLAAELHSLDATAAAR